MTRRGFLGTILAASAAPALVRADSLMKIITPAQGLILPLGMTGAVREIRCYEVNRDAFITRWDVCGDVNGSPMQIHVGIVDVEHEPYKPIQAMEGSYLYLNEGKLGLKNLPENRELALAALRKRIDAMGMQVVHGRLELPEGVRCARFV